MGKHRKLNTQSPDLQGMAWPPVLAFRGLGPELETFMHLSESERKQELKQLRANRDSHGRFVHGSLGIIYSYLYGYADSPCYLSIDDCLESDLLMIKIQLERELMDYWLPTETDLGLVNQLQAADYLQSLMNDNPAVHHSLYKWLATGAKEKELLNFLDDEAIRNEVVDDEVARLTCGHQGQIKNMSGVNLWDELGRGELRNAHTYWLRMYIRETDGWDRIRMHRTSSRQWHSGIMSNNFNLTLTRSGLKFAAYGHFAMTEALVCPHFDYLIEGMDRLGICGGDARLYFKAHAKLDPFHASEMISGIAVQVPALTKIELNQIVLGARWAIAGGVEQYDRVFAEFMKQQLVVQTKA